MGPAKFKAAAVHAAPVYMDKTATLQKVIRLIKQAGEEGIDLLVFPETFVPGYPVRTTNKRSSGPLTSEQTTVLHSLLPNPQAKHSLGAVRRTISGRQPIIRRNKLASHRLPLVLSHHLPWHLRTRGARIHTFQLAASYRQER